MRFGVFTLVSFLMAFVPSAAFGEPTDEERGAARELVLEGNNALAQKDYSRALSCFERADALFHAPTISLGLARARAGLGKLVGAREAYSRLANETIPVNAPEAFREAVADAKKELAAIGPRVPYVILVVQGTDSATASVTIDGSPVPAALHGVKRPTDPGRHVVRAVAAGSPATEQVLNLEEGRTQTVTLLLKPERADVQSRVPVEPGSPLPQKDVYTPLAPRRGARVRTLGWTSLGAGAAGLIAGGISGGLALAKHGDIVGQCRDGHCPVALGSDVDTFKTYGTLSTVGFIAGGALTAAGATLLLVNRKSEPSVGALTPIVAPGFLGLQGSF